MGETTQRTLIFTYGTLKRSLPNHRLMESAAAALISPCCATALPHPLVVGPNGIPFLIALPGAGRRVSGELYSVPSAAALAAIDDFEGVDRGHYERLPVTVVCGEGGEEREVMAYFAHREYGERLWRRCGGEEGALAEYTAAEAEAYVPPGERCPVPRYFLGELRRFLQEGE